MEKVKEFRQTRELHVWDKNPRGITESGFERLKKQIKKLGQYKPLLIKPDGTVIGGNMRLRAYQELNISPVWVSTITFEKLGDAFVAVIDGEKQEGIYRTVEQGMLEYALSDNDRAGYYEDENLVEIIDTYKDDIDFGDYSLDLGEPISIQGLIDKYTPDEEDEPPEVSDEPAISKLGEVYQLGKHRLMCGDSTKIEDVEKLMNGQKADMVFTDPPYGVNYEEKTRNIANQRKDILPVANDNLGKDALKEIVFPAFQNIATMLKNGGAYYVCSPQGGELGLMMMMMDAGIPCRHMIVWKKDAPVFSMGRLDYDYQHEPILYGWRGSHQFYGGGQFKSSVWDIPRPKSSKLHPTMKPIELVSNAIKNGSKSDDVILDLFGGSGSTLIACEQTNRTCYMMEIDPKYCDVIRRRYWKFVNNGDDVEWDEHTPGIDKESSIPS